MRQTVESSEQTEATLSWYDTRITCFSGDADDDGGGGVGGHHNTVSLPQHPLLPKSVLFCLIGARHAPNTITNDTAAHYRQAVSQPTSKQSELVAVVLIITGACFSPY